MSDVCAWCTYAPYERVYPTRTTDKYRLVSFITIFFFFLLYCAYNFQLCMHGGCVYAADTHAHTTRQPIQLKLIEVDWLSIHFSVVLFVYCFTICLFAPINVKHIIFWFWCLNVRAVFCVCVLPVLPLLFIVACCLPFFVAFVASYQSFRCLCSVFSAFS